MRRSGLREGSRFIGIDVTKTRLILMRHAKSSWYSGEQDDFLRPLNERGMRDARHMGQWLAQIRCMPANIVSSPSRRTRETLDLLGQGAQVDLCARTEWVDELYLASVPTMLEVLSLKAAHDDLMLMGHNPGMEDLLDYLVGEDSSAMAFGKLFPTGALYVLETPRRLDDLGRNCASILMHQRPKALSA